MAPTVSERHIEKTLGDLVPSWFGFGFGFGSANPNP